MSPEMDLDKISPLVNELMPGLAWAARELVRVPWWPRGFSCVVLLLGPVSTGV
jgi:hypothetical protein